MKGGADRFFKLKLLGSGSYGNVDGARVAIKIVRDVAKASKVESKVISSIPHPFIVSVYSSFVAKQQMHICMEYLSGGNLLNLI
jgi:serine/threonine protein kinase